MDHWNPHEFAARRYLRSDGGIPPTRRPLRRPAPNSPQVLFFLPLIRRWIDEGHHVEVTSRPYAQTLELCDRAGLAHTVVGAHGGKSLWKIGGALLQRAGALRSQLRSRAREGGWKEHRAHRR